MTTKDDAIDQIKQLSGGTLTGDDIIGLQNCTPDQMAAILTAYRNLNAHQTSPFWQQVAAILKQVPDWAQTAVTIIGVLAKVFP